MLTCVLVMRSCDFPTRAGRQTDLTHAMEFIRETWPPPPPQPPQPPPQQQQQQQQPMLPSPLPSLSLAPSWSSDTVMFNGFLSHNWVSNNYP